jgi:hypothetical protein
MQMKFLAVTNGCFLLLFGVSFYILLVIIHYVTWNTLGTSNSIMSASTSTDTLEQGMVYTWDVLLYESTVTKFKLSQ